MQLDPRLMYEKSLLGGLGGLIGWGLMSLAVFGPADALWRLFVKDAVTGALIGLALGAATGAYQGLFRDRSRARLLHGARVGALLGTAGGVVGLVLGEAVFTLAGGGLFARSLGWAAFGALVGASEGIALRMPQKTMFGGYGGLLGGLVGGSTYETLAFGFQSVGVPRGPAVALGGAIGLVLVGLAIGLLTALVEDLLRTAWLLFTSGRLEGQTRTLDPKKAELILGRADAADICLLGDPAVAPRHARIFPRNGRFTLEPLDGAVAVSSGGGFTPAISHPLAAGDLIQVGSFRAKFLASGAAP
jgi:hypothetical protein